MKPDTRIQQLESRYAALLQIIEKQNDTLTALTLRVDRLEKGTPKPSEYVPQFTQWPGNR